MDLDRIDLAGIPDPVRLAAALHRQRGHASGGTRRARFSTAHELGHFLLERHVLSDGNGFACNRSDMSETR